MSTPDSHTPAPSADAERPAEAFPPFTERPPEIEVWRRARQDYLGGDTARVVCERYGLSQATFYRHATKEGWRRTDVEACLIEEPPDWALPGRNRAVDVIADHPEYAAVQAAKDNDAYSLLFNPHPDDLRGFAFRRACEAAAMHRPSESAAWLRVQKLLDRCDAVPDPRDGPYRPEDHLRAAFLKAAHPDPHRGPEGADDAKGESN